MFEGHPAFEEPDDDARVWRYMRFTKFVSLIVRRELYFTRVDKHSGDQWEGAIPRKQMARLVKADEAARQQQAEFFRELQRLRRETGNEAAAAALDASIDMVCKQKPFNQQFWKCQRTWCAINCWSIDEHESDALWRLYVSAGDGVAISTTFGKLKAAFHRVEEPVYAGKVRYIDYATEEIALNNMFAPLMCKRKSFRHENELRILVARALQGVGVMHDESYPSPWGDKGDYVAVDLDLLVSHVYVSPRAESWFRELVESVVTRYELKKGVSQSLLDEESVF